MWERQDAEAIAATQEDVVRGAALSMAALSLDSDPSWPIEACFPPALTDAAEATASPPSAGRLERVFGHDSSSEEENAARSWLEERSRAGTGVGEAFSAAVGSPALAGGVQPLASSAAETAAADTEEAMDGDRNSNS